MTPNEKAEAAKQVLESPVMKRAFADIREGLVLKLESVEISDVDTQHEVSLMLQLLKRLQTQLNTYVQEQTLDKHRQKQESFIERARESLARVTATR